MHKFLKMKAKQGGFGDNNDAALHSIEHEQNKAQVLVVMISMLKEEFANSTDAYTS